MASMMNWAMMFRRLAPTARRTPISRVRSVTETSMMFMMPMPAARSAMELTTVTPMRTARVKVSNCAMSESLENNSKSSGCAGRHLAGRAQDAAHLFLAIGITGRAARLDQDAQTGPAQAVAVERRGEGHDGKIVLVAAQRSAFGRQHADDGVIECR